LLAAAATCDVLHDAEDPLLLAATVPYMTAVRQHGSCLVVLHVDMYSLPHQKLVPRGMDTAILTLLFNKHSLPTCQHAHQKLQGGH
jgi:hypothetical protein